MRPHSLGKPIEWKLEMSGAIASSFMGPHSLGKPIEWKLCSLLFSFHASPHVPTRWGNQLNGNFTRDETLVSWMKMSPLAGETN